MNGKYGKKIFKIENCIFASGDWEILRIIEKKSKMCSEKAVSALYMTTMFIKKKAIFKERQSLVFFQSIEIVQ